MSTSRKITFIKQYLNTKKVKQNSKLFIGGVCLILTCEYFFAEIIAQFGSPGYNMTDLDISVLGVTTCGPFTGPATQVTTQVCSHFHALMNSGFVALGILTIAGIFLSSDTWTKRKLTTTGLSFIMLGGLGEILIGAFAVNENFTLHACGALLHWIFGGIGVLLIGLTLWKTRRNMAIFSLLCASIVFIGFFLYISKSYLRLGRGTMERITAYPLTIWLIVIGFLILRENASQQKTIAFTYR